MTDPKLVLMMVEATGTTGMAKAADGRATTMPKPVRSANASGGTTGMAKAADGRATTVPKPVRSAKASGGTTGMARAAGGRLTRNSFGVDAATSGWLRPVTSVSSFQPSPSESGFNGSVPACSSRKLERLS